MAAIAQLKAMLGMDTRQFKAGMRDSAKATGKLQSQLAGVGRTLGAAFSVGAIVAATKRTIEFASQVRHASDNLEISTEAYQGITASALKYGASQEAIATALGRVKDSQGKVIAGDKEYVDALNALNISADKFGKIGADKALELIAKGYATATDRAAAFEAVSALAGRQGKNLTAFLKELADVGLQGVIDKGIEAGQVLGDDLVTQLEAAGTAIEQFERKSTIAYGSAITGAADYSRWVKEIAAGQSSGGLQGTIDRRLGLTNDQELPSTDTLGTMREHDQWMREQAKRPDEITGTGDEALGAVDEATRKKYEKLAEEDRQAGFTPEEKLAEVKAAQAENEAQLGQGNSAQQLYETEIRRLELAKQRKQIEEDIYKRDMDLLDKEMRRKKERQAIQDRAVEQVEGTRASFEEQMRTGMAGRGMDATISSTGAFSGTERGNLGVEDRQLQIASEGLAVWRQIQDINRRMEQDLRLLRISQENDR